MKTNTKPNSKEVGVIHIREKFGGIYDLAAKKLSKDEFTNLRGKHLTEDEIEDILEHLYGKVRKSKYSRGVLMEVRGKFNLYHYTEDTINGSIPVIEVVYNEKLYD